MPDNPGLPAPPPASRGAAAELALATLDALEALGETIEDEWTYVTALAEAGRARVRAVAGSDAAGTADADPDAATSIAPAIGAAVAAVCAEAARITDPHRAIDWLSTLPAVVELALGPGGHTSHSTTEP